MSMTKIRLALALFHFFVCSAVISSSAQAIPITGTVVLSGSVTGSGTGPDADYAKNYSGPSTVTATYIIAGKTDASGKVVFDPTGSTVTFKDKKWNWSTLSIPITSIVGDLGKDQLTSFDFSGTNWYPDAALEGIINNGLSGSMNIANKTAGFVASYKDTPPGTTVFNYSFSAVPEPTTILLMGTGLAGLIGTRIIRRKNST